MPEVIWELSVFNDDDSLAVIIPLTDEQAEKIKHVIEKRMPIDGYDYGEVFLDNVFFGAIAKKKVVE